MGEVRKLLSIDIRTHNIIKRESERIDISISEFIRRLIFDTRAIDEMNRIIGHKKKM